MGKNARVEVVGVKGDFGHQVGATRANIGLTKPWGLVSRH